MESLDTYLPPTPLRLHREGYQRIRVFFERSGFSTGHLGAWPIRMTALIESAPAKESIGIISFISRWTHAPWSSYEPRPRSSRTFHNDGPPSKRDGTSVINISIFVLERAIDQNGRGSPPWLNSHSAILRSTKTNIEFVLCDVKGGEKHGKGC